MKQENKNLTDQRFFWEDGFRIIFLGWRKDFAGKDRKA